MDVLATHALGWTLADADGSHQYSKCVAGMTPSTEGLRILDEFHPTMLWLKMRRGWREKRERESEALQTSNFVHCTVVSCLTGYPACFLAPLNTFFLNDHISS